MKSRALALCSFLLFTLSACGNSFGPKSVSKTSGTPSQQITDTDVDSKSVIDLRIKPPSFPTP